MAITPFKVIQGHGFWYQSKATGGRFILTPSLWVIPCEYRYKWYTIKN